MRLNWRAVITRVYALLCNKDHQLPVSNNWQHRKFVQQNWRNATGCILGLILVEYFSKQYFKAYIIKW